MEEGKTNYVVLIVRKTGSGSQKYKQYRRKADSLTEARKFAKQMSEIYQFSSAVIVDGRNDMPIEFWNAGKTTE